MNESLEWTLHSDLETKQLAEKFSNFLQPGDVFALEGDLGAGKTTFSQGIAKGLGVQRQVDSPTFTIIKEYRGRLPLYHMDVYRLNGVEDELGMEEYFYGDGICLVEWASKIKEILPEDTVYLLFRVRDNGVRTITMPLTTERAKRLGKDVSSL